MEKNIINYNNDNANFVLSVYDGFNESTHGHNLINEGIRSSICEQQRSPSKSEITDISIFLLQKQNPEVGGPIPAQTWQSLYYFPSSKMETGVQRGTWLLLLKDTF